MSAQMTERVAESGKVISDLELLVSGSRVAEICTDWRKTDLSWQDASRWAYYFMGAGRFCGSWPLSQEFQFLADIAIAKVGTSV